MIDLKKLQVWFITGSQHLYGEETLKQVAADSQQIVKALNKAEKIPVEIVFKPVVKTPDEIYNTFQDANAAQKCIGVITWCHTFSPSKMWINGLKILSKPLLHLHTQYNRDIPWSEIDMNFMNYNLTNTNHNDTVFLFLYKHICTFVIKKFIFIKINVICFLLA